MMERMGEAREQMSIAALEAGIAFNNASVSSVGMSRPIDIIPCMRMDYPMRCY